MTKQQCPLCGLVEQVHQIKPMRYIYKEVEFIINQPAKWCNACGEGIIDKKDNDAVLHLIQAEKAKIDGVLTPKEVQAVRKQLKLTQKQAAVIFGGGVNAFNRYEKGRVPVPRALSQLLIVLRNHPNQLKEIMHKH